MAAVEKALAMLTDLRTKVMNAGNEEAKTYETFGCFCKDTSVAKNDAIQKGRDEKDTLVADIQSLATKRDGFDQTMQDAIAAIAMLEQDMQTARQERRKGLLQFETDSADLKGALDALDGAIRMLKAAKTVSLVQLKSSSPELRKAFAMADALGFASSVPRAAGFLQQSPDASMEEYSFSSDSIITTLEDLQTKFRDQRTKVDDAEAQSKTQFDTLIQDKTAEVKTKQTEMDQAKQDKAQATADIESANKRLSTVSATLIDDQEYAAELASMCQAKAQTYDKRSKIRTDELQALSQAITVVETTVGSKVSGATVRLAQAGVNLRLAKAVASDSAAMSAIEASVEEEERRVPRAASLLATARRHRTLAAPAVDAGRHAVESLLRTRGVQLRSTLLTALATKIAEDPFAKVKQLIQDLIERLQKQAVGEANQKGWCDKSVADAEQRRDYGARDVREHNDRQAVLVALRDQLKMELDDLANTTQQLKDDQAEAERLRGEEKTESANTVQEAKEGLAALNEIIDILQKFYKTAENQAKAALIQQAPGKGPAGDAPDAGFGDNEQYAGAGSAATGVIGMLEVMRSDFQRTVSETEVAEKEAEQKHLEFMTESSKSLAEKDEVQKAKTKQLGETETEYTTVSTALAAASAKVSAAVKELLALHPACFDTGATYEERSSRRDDEVQALNKALCILGAYDEQGATGIDVNAC